MSLLSIRGISLAFCAGELYNRMLIDLSQAPRPEHPQNDQVWIYRLQGGAKSPQEKPCLICQKWSSSKHCALDTAVPTVDAPAHRLHGPPQPQITFRPTSRSSFFSSWRITVLVQQIPEASASGHHQWWKVEVPFLLWPPSECLYYSLHCHTVLLRSFSEGEARVCAVHM